MISFIRASKPRSLPLMQQDIFSSLKNTVVQISCLLLSIALGACSVSSSDAIKAGNEIGETRKAALIQSQDLLAEIEGWRIWVTRNKEHTACVAIKPAQGMPWPTISSGYVVSGGAGFNMYILDHLEIPFFGFYGENPFGTSIAEINGKTERYFDDRDTILGWQGLTVNFQVFTQPQTQDELSTPLWERKRPLIGLSSTVTRPSVLMPLEGGRKTTGAVDFTGVNKAYQALMRCHAA